MTDNPYCIEGPALISFSGGRTSGYMLWHILDAFDGKLPNDIHVCFANTGKEREETLRFVHECETHWGVDVEWLEWRSRPSGNEGRATPVSDRFALVNYNSASRDGEPFSALIARKKYTPNPVTRFCTMEMKIEVMKWFMLSRGYDKWSNVVGLRADEMLRVFKAYDRNAKGGERWQTIMPMVDAKVRQEDVLAWWARQPFDLQLKHYEGNCDLCFLKGREKLKRIIRENPGIADWWIEQEAKTETRKIAPIYTQPDPDWPDDSPELEAFEPELIGHREVISGRFRNDYSYADLVREVAESPMLPMQLEDDEEFDAECGLWCSGEAA